MIEEGVKLKKLTTDYALYGHRQFYPTLSPGQALYDIINTWDHWREIEPNSTTTPPPSHRFFEFI